jgi:hypothetical protein
LCENVRRRGAVENDGDGHEDRRGAMHALVYPAVLDRPRVTRRTFLTTTSALLLPGSLRAQIGRRETLHNGIVLPAPWPPNRLPPSGVAERPPYLDSPPPVIDISVGRQLFVDDFLIEESSLHRAFHRASYHPDNPVLGPDRDWETRDPYAINTKTEPSQSAMVYSDGVFYDPADQLFKMWYMAGYQQATALATSRDGIRWQRPNLPVVPGTNIVLQHHRDSSTVWLDLDTASREARYKMATFVFEDGAMRLSQSADGIHWRPAGITGPCADRSTMFRNPFRGVWVFSLRADDEGGSGRYRRFLESRSFAQTTWTADDPVSWVGADALDTSRPDLRATPELYNLDAVAYESVMLGLFTVFRGEPRDREKPNDVCVGFSRDGFHWDRSSREPFMSVSERPGDWNFGNVQSAGGGCLIVGDRLYFYISGRQGVPGSNLPGRCSTGLATLRRDGFASLGDEWPKGSPRRVGTNRTSVVTRPLRCRGAHVFVNAECRGDIRVEVLDQQGAVVRGYSAADCVPIRGDSTRHAVAWNTHTTLEAVDRDVIRLRFVLSQSRLYSFWIADSAAARSRGYVGAGGPGFSNSSDS